MQIYSLYVNNLNLITLFTYQSAEKLRACNNIVEQRQSLLSIAENK